MTKKSLNWSLILTPSFGIILIVLFGVFLQVKTGQFANIDNFSNLLHHSAVLGLLTLGLTFVIITGEFDLGLGNLNGLSGLVVSSLLIWKGWTTWPAILATVLAGLVLGAGVGYLVGYRRYLSIAVTLASANIFLGLAYLISEGQPIRGEMPPSFRTLLGTGATLGLPNAVWVMIICYAIGYFVLDRHRIGHYLYAISGNRDAAKAAGIPVRRLAMGVFMVSGMLAALGACLNAAWLGSGQPRVGPGFTLPMFAAVFFGIALGKGRATLWGSLQGVLLIAVINNGTALLGSREFVNQILVGGLLLMSVLIVRWNALWSWWRARQLTPTAIEEKTA